MAITSQPPSAGVLGAVVIGDWREAGLLKPSVLKPVLTTIATALLVKKLGRLNGPDQVLLRQAIAQIIG